MQLRSAAAATWKVRRRTPRALVGEPGGVAPNPAPTVRTTRRSRHRSRQPPCRVTASRTRYPGDRARLLVVQATGSFMACTRSAVLADFGFRYGARVAPEATVDKRFRARTPRCMAPSEQDEQTGICQMGNSQSARFPGAVVQKRGSFEERCNVAAGQSQFSRFVALVRPAWSLASTKGGTL